jgi:hypothetical protein
VRSPLKIYHPLTSEHLLLRWNCMITGLNAVNDDRQTCIDRKDRLIGIHHINRDRSSLHAVL